MARYPGAAGRVTVAPLGSSPALRADPALDLPPGFVLAVGTLEPRKNLPRLVEAYARLPEELQAAHPLLVAGRIGWDAAETLGALAGLGERCRLLGPVSDPQLAALYERCTVFCYPSLAEGFGLPVLEAMAAGAAVITSGVSSLPEVGGDAVEYVMPTDTGSIAAALERLLRDPQRRARPRNGGARARAPLQLGSPRGADAQGAGARRNASSWARLSARTSSPAACAAYHSTVAASARSRSQRGAQPRRARAREASIFRWRASGACAPASGSHSRPPGHSAAKRSSSWPTGQASSSAGPKLNAVANAGSSHSRSASSR